MTSKKRPPHPDPLPKGEREKRRRASNLKVPMAAPNMRIGMLGGSFNPAHPAHRQVSLAALKRLRLDQVWWLVSPGNPLKAKAKTPDLETRITVARAVAHHPKIVVTGFEGARPGAAGGSAYTIDTIRFLKRRYPAVNFVWLMGADNLASFHLWRSWETLFRLVPIAVLDRPGYRLKARASRAAQRFATAAIDESDAPGLPGMEPPAWTLLTLPLSSLSSTRLRGGKEAKPASGPSRKAAEAAKKEIKQAVKAAKRRVKKDAKAGKARRQSHKEK
ncbi:MAG TPA: nicotinate-nucleotide adenylyltransferase [Methyloceanibacter sp.]|nr:nicotinate-nucleotide adenylyltransferase [Methyloceanibacter sp.]